VFLSGGFAYVCQKDLASLVVQDFRSQLSKGLSQINRRWREVFPDSDQRLRPLVEGLSQRYLGPDLGSTTQQRRSDLTPANLNAVATRHFPLCMQQLMVSLRRDHHLRHNGRQQLSLFLKAIGLPLEDAMVFWRSEFAPKIPADKFDKEYAYNIRHNYGKEGKMTEYTAHNCVSIIRMSGGTEDHHGCPYRRMDEASLRANLAALSCSEAGVNEAMQKKAQGHFQIACACAFQGIHKAEADLGINHPAQYYSESRRVYDEREAAAGGSKNAAALPSSS
jgi:DNA primase large subunit